MFMIAMLVYLSIIDTILKRRKPEGGLRAQWDASSFRHSLRSKTPVHKFGIFPRNPQLFSNLGPHAWFEANECTILNPASGPVAAVDSASVFSLESQRHTLGVV
ncbi:hypothetical protein E4U33_005222 [Claviceps sp. LM78 group G4]|nr:hypothetical protein E4U33_005222 [Claviceps sp. LM78 group G4]